MGAGINIQPVILCGGAGMHLWPLSRPGFPRQFLSLTGDTSLTQLAVQRLAGLDRDDIHVAKPLIVTGEEHPFLALEQLREARIELSAVLLEPAGKNTAPVLILAALATLESGGDPGLVVTPADQAITDTATFSGAMRATIGQAATGSVVILGFTPDHAATGYGYIQAERFAEDDIVRFEDSYGR
jgi:mannose-1-phosphate guanylyltransferase/mannose-6-phosphate isomerase